MEIPLEGLELAGFNPDQPRGQPGNAGRWAKNPQQAAKLQPPGDGGGGNLHRLWLRSYANDPNIIGSERHGWHIYETGNGVVAFGPDGNTRANFDNITLAHNVIDAYSQADTEYNAKWLVDTRAKLAAMRNSFKVTHPVMHYRGTAFQYRPDDPKIDGVDPFFAVLPDGGLYRAATLEAVKNKTNSWLANRGIARSALTSDEPPAVGAGGGMRVADTYRGIDILSNPAGGYDVSIPGGTRLRAPNIDAARMYLDTHRPDNGTVIGGRLVTPAVGGGVHITSTVPGGARTWAPDLAAARVHIEGTRAPAAPAPRPPRAAAVPKSDEYKEPSWDGPLKRERSDTVPFDGPTLVNGKKVLVRNPNQITSRMIKDALGREDYTVKQMVALTAPREGAVVTISEITDHKKMDSYEQEKAVSVTVRHPDYHAERTIHANYIYNNIFEKTSAGHAKGSALSALGVDVVADQVAEADKVGGIKKLKLLAAGEGNHTHIPTKDGRFAGYYLWPRMGYDAPIDMDNFRNPARAELKDRIASTKATRLSDIMRDEVSTYLWQKHGASQSVEFDLTDTPIGQNSRKMLKNYYDYKHKGDK